MALPLAWPKDCLKSVVPLKLWKFPDVGVTVRPCWIGEFDEVRTGVNVVDPWEPAAACSKVANCSGLYSVLGIFDGLGCSLVTADMLGNRTEAGGGPDDPDVGIPVGVWISAMFTVRVHLGRKGPSV